jgi:hypothetical protein
MSVCFATALSAFAGYVVFLASLCAIDGPPNGSEAFIVDPLLPGAEHGACNIV